MTVTKYLMISTDSKNRGGERTSILRVNSEKSKIFIRQVVPIWDTLFIIFSPRPRFPHAPGTKTGSFTVFLDTALMGKGDTSRSDNLSSHRHIRLNSHSIWPGPFGVE